MTSAYPQYETLQFCQSRGIQAEAWSPLGRGRLLEDPLVLELAKKIRQKSGANLSALLPAK